jgi:hypothetical protein
MTEEQGKLVIALLEEIRDYLASLLDHARGIEH